MEHIIDCADEIARVNSAIMLYSNYPRVLTNIIAGYASAIEWFTIFSQLVVIPDVYYSESCWSHCSHPAASSCSLMIWSHYNMQHTLLPSYHMTVSICADAENAPNGLLFSLDVENNQVAAMTTRITIGDLWDFMKTGWQRDITPLCKDMTPSDLNTVQMNIYISRSISEWFTASMTQN